MSGYYRRPDVDFAYWASVLRVGWREAQIGALGALLAHWSVRPADPALLSLPTGSGKSAIAAATPHLAGARRTLVVVPSRHLRSQMVQAFAQQEVLRSIGALRTEGDPVVVEVSGRVENWEELRNADVVVGLPQSLSPSLYDPRPPADLFDLVVMDEAHHATAASWHAILEHYAGARGVLLTATPKRRDGKRVPGEPVYHYPLAKAIADGVYRPVRAVLLEPGGSDGVDECDALIRDEVLRVLAEPEHASSTLLVRASSAERANHLARMYTAGGRQTIALTNRLNESTQRRIIADLLDGSVRSVAVVSMLGEGFDLPSIRVVAYHDKHRSMPATTQLIGRLVRNDRRYPQEPVLVAARDIDVFPALQGAVRDLYAEDAHWAELLPGILDAEAQEMRREREFVQQLEGAPNELSLSALRIPVRATVYETSEPDWRPDFDAAASEFAPGTPLIAGNEVFYSTVTPGSSTMLIITRSVESPRWHSHPGLDSSRFNAHLVTWVRPRLRGEPGLVLVNSTNSDVRRLILDHLGTGAAGLRGANPQRLHGAFDALARVSVSNVGVRNTHVGARRGTASYKTFAGSGVDRGLREADTAAGAIGHAMAQVSLGPGRNSYNAGIAVEKAKMWESRYVTLPQYEEVMAGFAARYRSSDRSANPLLPDVSRGYALTEFPTDPVAFTEWHPGLIGSEWTLQGTPLDYLDLRVNSSQSTREALTLELRDDPEAAVPLWSGRQTVDGEVTSQTDDLRLDRGYSGKDIAALLTEFPATVRYASGTSVVGRVLYERLGVSSSLERVNLEPLDWHGVNVCKETDEAARKAGAGVSVQARVRQHLTERDPQLAHRWVLHNDGSGEFADLLVLETDLQSQARLELWHLKPSAHPVPAARVRDIEVVGAQAAKSRRWFTDPGLFAEMRARFIDGKAPRVSVIDGNSELLRELLSEATVDRPWTLLSARPVVRGDVVIAQPGLSWSALTNGLAAGDQSAHQVRDLLTVFDDALTGLAESRVVCAA